VFSPEIFTLLTVYVPSARIVTFTCSPELLVRPPFARVVVVARVSRRI
jgi:hypothetical protein